MADIGSNLVSARSATIGMRYTTPVTLETVAASVICDCGFSASATNKGCGDAVNQAYRAHQMAAHGICGFCNQEAYESGGLWRCDRCRISWMRGE